MKRRCEQIGSLLLALCMVMTMLPAPVFAASPPDGSETFLDLGLLPPSVDGTNWSYSLMPGGPSILTVKGGDNGTFTLTGANAGLDGIQTVDAPPVSLVFDSGTDLTVAGAVYGVKASGDITVEGGNMTVTASDYGLYAQGSIIIDGGSVNATVNKTPENSAGQDVYLTTLTLAGVSAVTSVSAITGLGTYGIDSVMTDAAGKLYFWLPEGSTDISLTTSDGKVYAGSVTVTAGSSGTATLQQKDITSDFTDPAFLAAVRLSLGKGAGDPIHAGDVSTITSLDVSFKSIESLSGIEHFAALTTLDCNNNKLTDLDTSKLTKLTYLDCSNNKLTGLDTSKLTELTSLNCGYNTLTDLDTSQLTKLTELDCSNNELTFLDTSQLTKITSLNCVYNMLTSLDTSQLTELTHLACSLNQLTSLDTSKLTKLKLLDCSSNKLTSLDTSKLTELATLYCSNNKLASLDTSKLTKLNFLICSGNRLETLDMSNSAGLASLDCSHNKLTSLNLTGGTNKLYNLQSVNCSYNRLRGLTIPEPQMNFHYFNGSHNWMTSALDVIGLPSSLPDGRILEPQDPEGFCAVIDITGLPSSAVAGEPLTLAGTILPVDAADGKAISFSVSAADSGATGAVIENGVLSALRPGTAIVQAVVSGGISPDENYGQNFYINVTATDITDDFTDPEFLTAVRFKLDKYNQQPIYLSEVSKITKLDVNNRNINSLNGIEHFISLEELHCSGNQLDSLDVRGLSRLTTLNCSVSQLDSLNVTGLTGLTTLNCSGNRLGSLEVTGLTGLTTLNCSGNQLGSLEVTGLTGLTTLNCYGNQLDSLDVTGLTGLTTLNCYSNRLDSLNVTGLTGLATLNCYGNRLDSLDVRGLTGLTTLYCNSNLLTSLKVEGLTGLAALNCMNNQLASLEVSGLTGLATLLCDYNRLTSLDITGLTKLNMLSCAYNYMTSEAAVKGYEGITSFSFFPQNASGSHTVTVINGSGDGTYSAGGTVVITPDAAPEGQRFMEWSLTPPVTFTEGTDKYSATAKFIMPDGDVTATALYEPLPALEYAVSVLNDGNGTASANVSSARAGAEITLSAAPNSGCSFAEWQVVSGGVSIVDNKFTMPAGNVTVKAIFRMTQIPAHTVTVNGSYASASGAGSYTHGAIVSVSAGSRSGYTFSGWNSSDSVVFASAGSVSTTFIMPDRNVTVTANWSDNGGSGDKDDKDDKDGSGSGSGGSSSTGAAPTSPTAGTIVTGGSAAATASVDGSGKASAAVTQAQISDAIAKAAEAAAGLGQPARVEIKVEAPADSKTVETTIPQASVRELAQGKVEFLTINTPTASITFDAKALSTISEQAAGDVKITTSRVDASTLSAEARQLVGDRPVFDFSVRSGGKEITQFGGRVTVSVPYTPGPGEDINAIVIYYINAKGEAEAVAGCRYDPASGRVVFETDHFSGYAVGYNKVTFKDVKEDAAYAGAVTFTAARGITGGTGNGNYSPGAELSRGEFLVMLMRAYGIEADTKPSDNFADAGDTWYTGYLAAAKRLGLSEGVGANSFAPERKITNQELYTLLYNSLKAINRLPDATSGKELAAYGDSKDIAPWAEKAMALFAKAGIPEGRDGRLNPKDTATRAEMARIMYSLLSK